MKINNHLLQGEGVSEKQSPNHSGKFTAGYPDSIIIHYTAGRSAESSVNTLCNPKTKASAHLVIGRDNSITQLVSFDTIAWHAGRSSYKGRVGFNKYSIGIEIDNAGRLEKSGDKYVSWFKKKYELDDVVEAVHRNESASSFWHAYTEDQVAIVSDICELLIDTYQITSILGHEEIAPKRKTDPGPAFPLDQLRNHLLVSDRSEDEKDDELVLNNAGLVSASKLNIRKSPDRHSDLAAPPLIKGALVDIVGESNGWYEVEFKTRGWVKKDYIKT